VGGIVSVTVVINDAFGVIMKERIRGEKIIFLNILLIGRTITLIISII